jgi:hypothetical protein
VPQRLPHELAGIAYDGIHGAALKPSRCAGLENR